MKTSRKRTALAVAMSTVAVAAIAAAWIASTGGAASPPPLQAFSNPGTAVSASASQQAVLERTGTQGSLVLLSKQPESSYFEITGTPRGTCYAVGADATTIDLVACDSAFLSSSPVLDVSVSQTDVSGNASFWRVDGWAADGVKKVELDNASGAEIAKTAVRQNVYSISHDSMPVGAVALIARDQSGKIVFSKNA